MNIAQNRSLEHSFVYKPRHEKETIEGGLDHLSKNLRKQAMSMPVNGIDGNNL